MNKTQQVLETAIKATTRAYISYALAVIDEQASE